MAYSRGGRYRRAMMAGAGLYPSPMHHPNKAEIQRLNRKAHTWTTGTSYAKLADAHYGDSKLWWIIAWYNMRPTDSHNSVGDVIYIPTPLSEIIKILRV